MPDLNIARPSSDDTRTATLIPGRAETIAELRLDNGDSLVQWIVDGKLMRAEIGPDGEVRNAHEVAPAVVDHDLYPLGLAGRMSMFVDEAGIVHAEHGLDGGAMRAAGMPMGFDARLQIDGDDTATHMGDHVRVADQGRGVDLVGYGRSEDGLSDDENTVRVALSGGRYLVLRDLFQGGSASVAPTAELRDLYSGAVLHEHALPELLLQSPGQTHHVRSTPDGGFIVVTSDGMVRDGSALLRVYGRDMQMVGAPLEMMLPTALSEIRDVTVVPGGGVVVAVHQPETGGVDVGIFLAPGADHDAVLGNTASDIRVFQTADGAVKISTGGGARPLDTWWKSNPSSGVSESGPISIRLLDVSVLLLVSVELNQIIRGSIGDDVIYGGEGTEVIFGGDGDDVLEGGDILIGGAGNDTLYGTDGATILLGGSGDDVIRVNDEETEQGGNWIATMEGGQYEDLAFSNSLLDGSSGFSASSTYDSLENLTYFTADDVFIDGGFGHDHIYGGSTSDRILGGSGVDKIWGRGGNDLISGGTGADSLNGGVGDDVLLGGKGDDVLIGGEGHDWYFFSRTSGRDVIKNQGASEDFDVIQFAAGISIGDLEFARVGEDLVATMNDSDAEVTIKGWWGGNPAETRVDMFRFDDGSYLSEDIVTQHADPAPFGSGGGLYGMISMMPVAPEIPTPAWRVIDDAFEFSQEFGTDPWGAPQDWLW